MLMAFVTSLIFVLESCLPFLTHTLPSTGRIKELLHQKQFFIILDKLLWNNISRLRSAIALLNIVTNFLPFIKTLKTVSFN